MKKTLGRPKTLDREKIIEIAYNEYWENGIFNVSLSKIASLASVSRPGIYKEFGDEDGLKTEVLKKYIEVSANPVHKNYDNYKQFPDQLFNHFDAILNDGNKYLTNDASYLMIKRPRKAIGCLMERTRLNINLLGPKAKKLLNSYTKYRKECFIKYIKNAQISGIFKKNLDVSITADYILAQFSMVQNYRLNGVSKNKIEKVLNTALVPLYK
tara:strand:+ start:38 stop:673 length:636 start_codon:yes stop_codon:yes gene_type:complete